MLKKSMVIALLIFPAFFVFAEPPRERQEFYEAFTKFLCTQKKQPSSLPVTLWADQVYDAQIEASVLSQGYSRELSLSLAQKKALSLAKSRSYQGYAYGGCADGRAWALAMPASQPARIQDGIFSLPQEELKKHCWKWRVDYAEADKGNSFELKAENGKINLSQENLSEGILSVSCVRSGEGPLQWYMLPVGKLNPEVVPQWVEQNQDSADLIYSWVNRLRKIEKLSFLKMDSELSRQAEILSVDTRVIHNRSLLNRSKKVLETYQFELIGEDRAKAQTLKELAALLWYSPRHRQLLLNKKASHIGIALRNLGSHELVVVLLARKPENDMKIGQDLPKRPDSSKVGGRKI